MVPEGRPWSARAARPFTGRRSLCLHPASTPKPYAHPAGRTWLACTHAHRRNRSPCCTLGRKSVPHPASAPKPHAHPAGRTWSARAHTCRRDAHPAGRAPGRRAPTRSAGRRSRRRTGRAATGSAPGPPRPFARPPAPRGSQYFTFRLRGARPWAQSRPCICSPVGHRP